MRKDGSNADNEDIGQETLTRSMKCYVKVCIVMSDLQVRGNQEEKESPIWLVEPLARMLAQVHNDIGNGVGSMGKRKSRSQKLPWIQRGVRQNRSFDQRDSPAQNLPHRKRRVLWKGSPWPKAKLMSRNFVEPEC